MMISISTEKHQAGSATIYQFPVGGRASLSTAGHDAKVQDSHDVVLTDAWYHQEAIRESQKATKQ